MMWLIGACIIFNLISCAPQLKKPQKVDPLRAVSSISSVYTLAHGDGGFSWRFAKTKSRRW